MVVRREDKWPTATNGRMAVERMIIMNVHDIIICGIKLKVTEQAQRKRIISGPHCQRETKDPHRAPGFVSRGTIHLMGQDGNLITGRSTALGEPQDVGL